MSEQMLNTLEEVLANANRLAASVTPEQWSQQTPCTEWDTRSLVNHMAGTCNVLAAAATKSEPTSTPDDDHVGDDPVGGLAAATERNLAAWRSDGALEGMVSVPAEMPAMAALGVTILDIGTHCWDLAQAIGTDHGLSAEAIATIDEWNRQVIQDDFRGEGKGFGVALTPESDDELATMLAFVGRRA